MSVPGSISESKLNNKVISRTLCQALGTSIVYIISIYQACAGYIFSAQIHCFPYHFAIFL